MEINLSESPPEQRSALIMPDIADFRSPVDGTVVHGRASLREHNRRNNVTNAADFKNTWEEKAKERADFYQGRKTDPELKRDLIDAYNRRNKNG